MPAVPILCMEVVTESPSRKRATRPRADHWIRRHDLERFMAGLCPQVQPDDAGRAPELPDYFYNDLHQIVQTKDQVLILTEMVHDARIVRMNAEHLPKKHLSRTIRRWIGDSVGHWEGDTLVVDTTNLNDKTRFRGSIETRSRTLHAHRRQDAPLPFHDRRPGQVAPALDRRMYVAFDRQAALRIRLPRCQLCARQHLARRAEAGGATGRAGDRPSR
jgi:hypothetical protein